MPEDQVPLREHIEALLVAHHRAEEIAERERARAAQVLAEGLERSIVAGDLALRDHISQQVRQIEAALGSADKRLEVLRSEMVLRDGATRDLLTAAAHSSDQRVREAFAASEKAIEKAEIATEKRLEGLNELRREVGDRWDGAMPREVAESRLDQMTAQIANINEKLGKLT
jgi:hypothetical protein